jgi:hypothetical protein
VGAEPLSRKINADPGRADNEPENEALGERWNTGSRSRGVNEPDQGNGKTQIDPRLGKFRSYSNSTQTKNYDFFTIIQTRLHPIYGGYHPPSIIWLLKWKLNSWLTL